MQFIRNISRLHACVCLLAITSASAVAFAFVERSVTELAHSNVAAVRSSIPSTNSVDVRFKDPSTDEAPDFQRHVAPLLGRLGCNGRACHGSFQGQGGFQLSLFGYDFESDHKALLEDGAGRVDLAAPENSLVLTKPTDEDNHEGGLRYETASWQFNLLKSWITNGARKPFADHKLDRLVVEPQEILLSDPTEKLELRAIAHWADGTVEEVTPLCRFNSNDDSIAVIDEQGIVSTNEVPGDTHVVVSYDSAVVPVPVIHPIRTRSADTTSTIPSPTRVDQLVAQKWNKLGLEPSELSDDAMFLRRVSIDITGSLPAPEEIREFLADTRPDKRRNKINELLETPAYAAWWTTFFCDMTENNTKQLKKLSYDNSNSLSEHWYQWIHRRVEENVPYDEMVAGIVTGVSRQPDESYLAYCERMTRLNSGIGSFADSESMPYYWMRREFQDRDARTISFAHAFLGLRIQCASCHKHPFDQWNQHDFQEFSKFFSGVTAHNFRRAKTPQDRKDYDQILAELDIDPKAKNKREVKQKLAQALKKGQTAPFGYLMVHQPKPSKAERQELQQKMKEARKKGKKAKFPKPKFKHAKLLGSDEVDLTRYKDARQPVMDWMRRPDNPFFAKALVNRIWARYFGIGIVDPADDLNLANPPSNAALLDYLATEFINQDFDLKWLHREITNSRTYQLSWVPNETNQHDRRNFSRSLPRRLPAEVVYDAITSAASNSKINRDFRESVDKRAISIAGTVGNKGGGKKGGGKKKKKSSSAFALQVFGRSNRTSSCDCDRSEETSLIQTVYMQNDRDIHKLLSQENSWISQMAARHQSQPVAEEDKQQLIANKARLARLKKAKAESVKSKNRKQARKINKRIENTIRKIESIQQRIAAAESQKKEMDITEVVTEAYLRTLSRMPSAAEIARCEAHIHEDKDLINGLTGVMWALVNTKEFIVNH